MRGEDKEREGSEKNIKRYI
jgi:hypothetical protein